MVIPVKSRPEYKSHHVNWLWPWLAGVLLLGMTGLSEAQTKLIHLRNEIISTTRPDRETRALALQAQAFEPAVSGLYLIQFTDRFQPGWRVELGKLRVDLVRFVPEDAFVARLDQTNLRQVRELPFVQWVGEYRPELRVHSSLQARLQGKIAATNLVDVRLLLSQRARPDEISKATLSLEAFQRMSKSSLGTVLQGKITGQQLAGLARSEAVLWIEPASAMRLHDEISSKIVGGGEVAPRRGGDGLGEDLSGNASTRKTAKGLEAHATLTQQLGFDGRGVTVAVADSGLHNGDMESMHPDLAGRVEAFFFYDNLEDAADEHSHGTHVTGIIAGDGATGEIDEYGALYGLGVAPGARIVAQRIFDGTGNYRPPPSFETLTRDAVQAGAVIGSNSWGGDTQGRYDITAAEFDALVRDADAITPGDQPYILVFSAGNAGPATQTIGTPAVAKNVIAAGASQNNRYEFPIYSDGQEVMADFSGRGPCEDGRIKPDLVAPGTWIASLQSEAASGINSWSAISPSYQYQGGTSQAGPHVSAAAAVFIQFYREQNQGQTPSPALVKAALINSAAEMGARRPPGFLDEDEFEEGGEIGHAPNMDEGWGRVDLTRIIGSSRSYEYIDQRTTLSTGQVYEQRVIVSPNARLKITLVYTDVPGLPAAIPALVNDLDLEVIAPDGKLYRGNAFFEGESVPDTPVGDRINNVEAVHLSGPLPGEYLVRVRARNVVEDIHQRLEGAPEQDFALVISGDLPKPGEGVIYWDRAAYRAPATATIRLIDPQLASQPTATIKVTSTTEPDGEMIVLQAVGAEGAFIGAVSLAPGPAAPNDGLLQVAHKDVIKAIYLDNDPPAERVAEAEIDLAPPEISEVVARTQFGRIAIGWLTDEATASAVVFGLPGNVTQVISNHVFQVSHSVDLPPLEAGRLYQFYLLSTDAAGNTTTNNNDGALFSFIAPQAATALLVYAPEWFADAFEPPFPGIETYTDALDALGVSYEVWELADRPAPTLEDLRPFQVVLWRPTESDINDASFTPAMQSAIRSYLAEGGALFMSSMQVLSRLRTPDGIAFMKEVLRVNSFRADGGALSLTGVTGDPVGRGSEIDLAWEMFPDLNWSTGPDHLTLMIDTAPVFLQEAGKVVGLRYPTTGRDAAGRLVFFSFPMEAVPNGEAPNNRATLLANALEFLVPGLRGVAVVALDAPAYTIPSAVVVEVTDRQRAGSGQVKVRVTSPNEPVPQELTLHETVRKGVFRAFFTLVDLNAEPGLLRLRAKHGDAIKVIYVDTENYETSTMAAVDTGAPIISYLGVEPDYNEAIVRWETSKLTDALVRFGEAGGHESFLTRTAYVPQLSTLHEVRLTGLQPGRDYYFMMISRDAAGNVASDSNAGQFYRFRTLKPIVPPWKDDFEDVHVGWEVQNEIDGWDDGDGIVPSSGWQHGTPENEHGITARSGSNCWATNLKGEWVELAMSSLISPAIDLTGGNKAALKFWHYYDFQGRSMWLDLEIGQVAISTNNGVSWSNVYAISEEVSFDSDWEEVEVDISRFTGHVVRIRWNYQMHSLESYPRPGWLVDDVSVTLEQAPRATLRISSNLGQASFGVTGPITRANHGTTLVITNAPTGEYTVTFDDVPFYVTPPPQTSLITDSVPVDFTGHYTFPDTNNNGISDLWEEHYFGMVSPDRLPTTDTDGDGASDYAEFIAGTNPLDPDSYLQMAWPAFQPNKTIRLAWNASPGRMYRVHASKDAVAWAPLTNWLRASSTHMSHTLPAPSDPSPAFFRLETRP
jgi:hypothetical protein